MEDYLSCCDAVLPAGGESAFFIKTGNLEGPECGVRGRKSLLSDGLVLNCFLLCTCRRELLFQVSWQHKHYPDLNAGIMRSGNVHPSIMSLFPHFSPMCSDVLVCAEIIDQACPSWCSGTKEGRWGSPRTLTLVFPGSFVGEQDAAAEGKWPGGLLPSSYKWIVMAMLIVSLLTGQLWKQHNCYSNFTGVKRLKMSCVLFTPSLYIHLIEWISRASQVDPLVHLIDLEEV